MTRHGAWGIWLLGAGLHVGIGALSARGDGFTSVRDAQAAWQKATNDAARQVVKSWLEERAQTCAPSQLSETLSAWRLIAAADKEAEPFFTLCARRGQNDTDPLSRHAMALRQAELHLALQNPQAAWTLLSTYLKNEDLTANWRAEAARAASDALSTHLLQPQQADGLLEQAMSIVTTNEPGAYASLGVARAAILRDPLHDLKGAEKVLRDILVLGPSCPGASYTAAVDGLAALLQGTDRAAAIPETLLLVAAHPATTPAGLSRKLKDCGASPDVFREAVRLLRMRAAAAAAADQAVQVERLHPELVELLLSLGSLDEAVRECRVLALCATDSAYPQAIELAARCFKLRDGNLGRANRLLDLHGEQGPPAGIKNPLFGLAPLDDPVRKSFLDDLSRQPVPETWTDWRRRATLLTWLDRPAEAFHAARMAFTVCPLSMKELQLCADGITRPVLVATRDTALAQRLTDYLLRGAAGPDGIMGNADDIEDPFDEASRRLACGEE